MRNPKTGDFFTHDDFGVFLAEPLGSLVILPSPSSFVTWRMIRTNQLATMWAPGKMMKQFGKTLEEARKTYYVTSSKHGKRTKKIKKVWIITMLSMVKSTTHGNVQ